MKSIITFLALLTFSFGAFGQSQPDKKLAIEFLKASRIEQSIDASLQMYSKQLVTQLPEDRRADFDKSMHEILGWDALKDQLADTVIKVYTKEELQAAITFMKSPVGAAFTLKGDQFSAQYAGLLSQKFSKFMHDKMPQKKPDAAK